LLSFVQISDGSLAFYWFASIELKTAFADQSNGSPSSDCILLKFLRRCAIRQKSSADRVSLGVARWARLRESVATEATAIRLFEAIFSIYT